MSLQLWKWQFILINVWSRATVKNVICMDIKFRFFKQSVCTAHWWWVKLLVASLIQMKLDWLCWLKGMQNNNEQIHDFLFEKTPQKAFVFSRDDVFSENVKEPNFARKRFWTKLIFIGTRCRINLYNVISLIWLAFKNALIQILQLLAGSIDTYRNYRKRLHMLIILIIRCK